MQYLNSYLKKIKLTLEEIPKRSLDTQIIGKNNTILFQVFIKLTSFPAHWNSNVPNYKRNAITNELHRAKKLQHTLIRNYGG